MLTVLREIYIIIGTSIFFILLVLTTYIMHTAITPNIEPRYAPNVLFTKRQNNWNAIPAAYIISFFLISDVKNNPVITRIDMLR